VTASGHKRLLSFSAKGSKMARESDPLASSSPDIKEVWNE